MRTKVSSKEKIIESAKAIIARDGLDACTSRNISKETGVALGTIYNYFSSRDELLQEVFINSWKGTQLVLEEILIDQLTPAEKARNMIQTLSLDVISRNGLGEYLFTTRKINLEEIKEKFNHFEEIIQIIIKLLRESESNKNETDLELRVIAQWIIFGHMNFIKRDLELEVYIDQVIKKFFS